MARKRRIVDPATEEAMSKARNAITMINARLMSKKLSPGDKLALEVQLASMKKLQKSLRDKYEAAKKAKFKSVVTDLLDQLQQVEPGNNMYTDLN